MDELKTPFEWERESNEKLRARIAELEAQLAEERARTHQWCSRCRTEQPCDPHGYDLEWECRDEAACAARVEADLPRRQAEFAAMEHGTPLEQMTFHYLKRLLEITRPRFNHTFARIDLDGRDDDDSN